MKFERKVVFEIFTFLINGTHEGFARNIAVPLRPKVTRGNRQ